MIDYGLTKALYVFLTETKTITKAVKRIYTHVPPDISTPYLHFYMLEAHDGSIIRECPQAILKIKLDLYSRGTSVIELHDIMGCLSQSLDGLVLPLAWNQQSGSACFKESEQSYGVLRDELTRKGELTYHCRIMF